jgi:adenine-specific DNA-methyltransferase
MQTITPQILHQKNVLRKGLDADVSANVFGLNKTKLQKYIQCIRAQQRITAAQSIVYLIMGYYWKGRFTKEKKFTLPKYGEIKQLVKADREIIGSCKILGTYAATLDVIEASYLIGNLYTATIPDDLRSTNGVYYTPPNLTTRLLNLAEKAGVNWATATILDPACGGGAFLAPVALRIASVLDSEDSNVIIDHIEKNLKGFEIDPFSAWLSQVFVEVAISKHCLIAKRRLNNIIEVRDSLAIENTKEKYDLIIGNPPYGKIKLETELRKKFDDCLYGHANLYGLFVHVAFSLVKRNGIVAYVTPTGFLGGQYFKKLRSFIAANSTPLEFDFLTFRKGIFEDVLQETMLTIYRKGKSVQPLVVNEILPSSAKAYDVHAVGAFALPNDPSSPWLLARNKSNAKLVSKLGKLSHHLNDWGYGVKTGPLVWNRHKIQLRRAKGKGTFPLIWAETISTKGEFLWKADKKNHTLYFAFKNGDEWLLEKKPCIIMQRTTAREQEKRLLTAILPMTMFKACGAVIIENHLNVIQPITASPKVSLELLNIFLSTKIADDVFRCISGSVAVSAYEIECMPLPNPELLIPLQKMLDSGTEKKLIEDALFNDFYGWQRWQSHEYKLMKAFTADYS